MDARRPGGRLRRRDRRVRPRRGRRARGLGRDRVVGHRVLGAQARRRRLLIVLGIKRLRQRDAVAATEDRRTRSHVDLPAGPDRQRAQPEDGALLPRVPPPVRRPRAGPRRTPGDGARARLHRHRHALRRRLGARRRSLAGVLKASERARRVERWASGGILIGLGVLATLAHPARGTREPARPRRGASRAATAGPWRERDNSTTRPASAKRRYEPRGRPAAARRRAGWARRPSSPPDRAKNEPRNACSPNPRSTGYTNGGPDREARARA